MPNNPKNCNTSKPKGIKLFPKPTDSEREARKKADAEKKAAQAKAEKAEAEKKVAQAKTENAESKT